MSMRIFHPSKKEAESKDEYPDLFDGYPSPEGRKLTLVVGQTGSGKSTFGNFMAKCKMTEIEDEAGDVFLQAEPGSREICKTSKKPISVTLYPQVVKINQETALLDCPCFADSFYGVELQKNLSQIANEYAIRKALAIQGIVVMIEYRALVTYNGSNGLTTLARLFIELEKMTGPLYCKGNHFLFLIKEAPLGRTEQQMLNVIRQHASSEASNHSGRTHIRRAYEYLSQPGRLKIFKPLEESQRDDLMKALKSLEPMKTQDIRTDGLQVALKELPENLQVQSSVFHKLIDSNTQLIQKISSPLSKDESEELEVRMTSQRKSIERYYETYKTDLPFIISTAREAHIDFAIIKAFEDAYKKLSAYYESTVTPEASVALVARP